MPMGPSADGSGWVNYNNTCQGDGCDQRMPLPKSHGKHCPKCGTCVPTWNEMQAGSQKPVPTCPSCDAKVKVGDRFCGECGNYLPPAAIPAPGDAVDYNPNACRSCGRSPCECGGEKCVCGMATCVCGCRERRGERPNMPRKMGSS